MCPFAKIILAPNMESIRIFLVITVIIFNAFLFKVVCTSVIIYPEVILVKFLKKAENLDVYENNIDFNPFKFYLE